MIWFDADKHFGHNNIIQYCKRPWITVADMDEAMVALWNAHVRPDDTVYHIGDWVSVPK